MAEAELLAAREGVAQMERGLAACSEDSVAAREQSVRALACGEADAWMVAQRSTELLVWRAEMLRRELGKRRDVEAEKLSTYTDARIRSEQTAILINIQRSVERAADDVRSQKVADEFALRKFCAVR